MSTETQAHRSKWRIRKAVCALVLLLGAALVAAESLYRHYADPERIRAIAEEYIQGYVNGRVTIGSAAVSLFDGVSLFDVSISEPDKSTAVENRSVFSCEELEINHSPLAALMGRLEIRSLVAFEPTCTIIHDADVGTTNLAGLFRGVAGGSVVSAESLPTVELRDARVRVLDRRPDGVHQIENLRLTVRGRPSKRDPGMYDVVWQGGEDAAPRGHSQIDLRTGYLRNVFGGLPAMSVEAVMLAVNATYDGAGALRDLLGLGGQVRARDYNLIDDSSTNRPRSATIDLQDASVSIPINDEDASYPTDRRYLRFTDVNGTVQVTTEEIRATFTGSFHGSACDVSAVLRGGVEDWTSLDDVDFEAELRVTGLELPRPDADAPAEQVRFISAWSTLARFYERYDPRGPVDLQIAVVKLAGEEESLVLGHALISAKGGCASYERFPYRVDGLMGSVELSPEGVWIRHLCGEHAGGTICADGSLERLGKNSAADITLTGSDIPIDDSLLNPLKPNHRKICEEFSPVGTIDVTVSLARPDGAPDGPPVPWNTSTTVTFDDLAASYNGFPYPVEGLGGTLLLSRNRLEIVELSGRSGDARIELSGVLESEASGAHGFELDLHARDVPFDDRLFNAFGADLRKIIEPFHPNGRFDVVGTLVRDFHEERTVPQLGITLKEVSVRHQAFPVEITDIQGRLDMTSSAIVVSDVTGRRDDTTVAVEGAYRHGGENAGLDMSIRCRGLHLDEALCAVGPPKVRELLAAWRVSGPVDADAFLKSGARGQAELTCRAELRMDGVTVVNPMFPIPFTDVRGAVTLDDNGARATAIRAEYGEASVQVDFQTERVESGDRGTIALTAEGATLDETIRDLLPAKWRATWDRLEPAGRFDLTLDRLSYVRHRADGPREWSVEGQINLRNGSLRGVANLSNMSGAVSVSGAIVDRLLGTNLSGAMNLSTADLLGQSLENVRSPWTYARAADGSGMLVLDDTRADCYEGRVTARTEVVFEGDSATYELSSTVHGAQIAPFIAAAGRSRPSTSGVRKQAEVRGRANTRLYLSGVVGDVTSRRGGGRVEVVDGYIYKLPIILAILNVLDLSVPNDEAFEAAEGDFYVVGNAVRLRNIILQGGVLTLVGSGSMSLEDFSVNLKLVNVAPRQWVRVPVLTEVIEGATRELMELNVTGPIDHPTVRPRPLPRLSDELKRLFQKKKPRKVTPSGS